MPSLMSVQNGYECQKFASEGLACLCVDLLLFNATTGYQQQGY